MSNEAHSSLKYFESALAYARIDNDAEVAMRLQTLMEERTGRVALVTIELHFEQEGRDSNKHVAHEEKVEQGTRYLLDTLRVLVRKTDIVYMLRSTCYFLLPGANLEGGRIVCNRLWDALLWQVHNIVDGDLLRPRCLSIGYAACPQTHEDASECVQASYEIKQHFEVQPERRRIGTRSSKIASGEYAHDTSTLHAHQHECIHMLPLEPKEAEPELSALARKLGIPYLSLLPRKKRAQVQQFVTLELAQELRCYPLGRERGMLTVAVADPQNSSVLDRLHQETGLHIFPVLTQPQELQMALDQLL